MDVLKLFGRVFFFCGVLGGCLMFLDVFKMFLDAFDDFGKISSGFWDYSFTKTHNPFVTRKPCNSEAPGVQLTNHEENVETVAICC